MLLAAAPLLCAQDEPEDAASLKILTHVAEALSEDNAIEALRSFDKNSAQYRKIEAALVGLTGQFSVSSSIDFLSREGNTLLVDWFLQLRGKADDGVLLRRRQQVAVTIANAKITALEPLSLFAPLA